MDERIGKILFSIQASVDALDTAILDEVVHDILCASGLFIAGAGRSGLVARMFAMRLMHLGLDAFVVGETTTPAGQPRDLLVCVSGSGETGSTLSVLEQARQLGMRTILITTSHQSRMALVSNTVVVIRAGTKHTPVLQAQVPGQIMGGTFEQGAFVFLEAVINELLLRLHLSSRELAQRHANLE